MDMKRTHYIYSIIVALFCWGMVTTAYAQEPTPAPEPNIKIGGSVYGGGALASVQSNTNVVINDGQFEQDVYGGGKGKLNDDDKTVKASADVTGNTAVTVNGGTFTFPEDGIDENVNHNVYGGGNLACNVGGNTNVTMNAGILPEGFYESESWTNWKNDFDAQNDNVAQGCVFGAGYGVHTNVAGTATIVVNANSTSLIDVIGGSYNGTVAGSTDVTVQSGNIYKVYGGGLGSYAGYEEATTSALNDNLGAVGTDNGNGTYTGGTNVTIKGGKFYNNIFGGGAGLKYNGGTSYLNVAKVNGTANVTIDAPAWIAGDKFSKNIYGGGALGLVADAISVTLKSGEFDGAQVFGGSLGEDRHANDKAKVTGNTHVLVTHNDATPTPDALKGHLDIYGGCDMAQVNGSTNVTVEYGTFYGSIFGGGLGRGTTYLGDNAEANKDYGKVTGNTNVIIDGGADWASLTLGAADKYTAGEASAANEANHISEGQPGYVREGDYKTPIKVYGGSALGLIGGTLDVKLKSGTLYGEMFGGSLGELGYVEKAKVTTVATISTEANANKNPLNGLFNIYGGCDMAQIQNNTHVNLQHGTFSGNIFGGGKGVEETAGTEVGSEQFVNYGKVTGTTNVLINGPQMTLGKATLYTVETAATANNAHLIKNNGIEPGQPGYIKKYDNEWLEVKAGDAATIDEEIKIYGGGALGLVDGTINTVNLQSGTLYGEVFGGSLGELGYLAKAKVTGDVGVKTTANDTKDSDGVTPKPDALNGKFTIYGGCEMAQVIGTTEVDIQHGTFLGGIFGGGKGLASAVDGEGNVTDSYMDYGKVEAQNDTKAACKVTFESDGSFGGDIYGGGALGLVETKNPATIKPTHITEVHLKKGDLNGKVFGAGLGEKIDADKAKVTGDTWVITDIPTDPATEILGGDINHVFGGGNMAQVDGNTLVEIIHGSFSGTIFGGGNGVAEDPGTPAGSEKYLDFGKVTETTHVVIDGPALKLGSVEGTYTAETAAIANAASGARENAYNYWKEGDDIITSTMSVYGGGALGMVGKNITVEVKSGEIYGDIFAGSLGELGHVDKAKVTADAEHTVTIGTYANTNSDALTGVFSMYGGCDMAQFEGNSKVDIQHGAFRGQIFGGGRGVSCAENGGEEKYGIVKGTTKVLFHSDGSFNGDIYGGGALGLVDPGTEPLPEYTTQVRLVYGNINGQVFGGGFGETTNYDSSSDEPAKLAALNTAKITGNTLVITDNPGSKKLGGEINHVYGGGNMATVDGNTRVEISHGSFSGTIFGGGNGVPSNAITGEEYLDFGKVTETTYVLIDGADLELGTADYYTASEATAYNSSHDLHDGDPDYKRAGDVKTVTSEMQIYGGGAMGMVDSNIAVDVKSGKIFGAVFAGSMGEEGHINKALVKSNSTQSTRVHLLANSKNDPLTGHFSVYGGCDLAMFEGESEVVINHGTFTGKIFGGGNGLTSTKTGMLASGGEPKYGQIKGVTRVIYDNDGTFNGDIYGGGAMGKIVPDAEAHLPALATDPITTVYLSKGTINGQVFGGSLGEKIDVDKAEVMGNTLVTTDVPGDYITGGAGRIGGRIENFFGGGDMARVTGDTYVTLTRGHFNGRIFGGGNGVPSDSESEYLEFGKVTGDTHVLVDRKNDSDNVLQLGENEKYSESEANTHNTALHATPGDVNYVQEGDYKKPMKIYGGGALGKVGGTINIAIKNGNHYGEVFGGSLGEKGHPNKALVTGNTNAWAVANKLVDDDPTKPANDALPLTGDLKFYGGCEMARVEGQSKVTINHGSFSGAIYGGGKGIPTYNSETYIEYGKVVGSGAVGSKASIVEFNNEHGTFTGNIYGGGALGKIESGLANVQMLAGNVKGNVYGGSYGENTLPEKGTAAATLVEMLGGNVLADNTDATLKGEIYGGGALANVAGNTEVHLYGGTVGGDVFGGGLGNANTAQKVGGNTLVNLGKKNNPSDTSNTPERSASEVGGSIFGCNNVNGTPEGHAKVHVIKTQSRASQASPANAADVENSYDVLAVYGGGNKAAYQPSNATITAGNGYAEVLIEYCDNSIAYVYGGGNAAPVPATQVRIYGANAIDHAFAGGNGKGVNNDGADVGYLNYYSTQTPAAIEYGSGTASIGVYGGTVHNVYGGSNTLGYIRTSASVNVETPKADDPYIGCAHDCVLNVGKTFGGGNMADMIGDINMRLDCTEGADIIFAGANNANVYGNIHLTVNSGTFRQVFCSNNQGGAVFGKLRLDVDETGCTPIIIKELFGGGNLAPYSVYGYKTVDGNLVPRTKQEFDALADGDKVGLPYADPVVNVTSCTAIGAIYGGGFGNTAVMYGNPIVNVDMVKGAFADRKLNSSNHNKQIVVIKDGILQTETEITIPDAIGTIGNIFGGGKQADVYGNTTVNVCVKDADPTLKNRNDNSEATTSAFIAPFKGDMALIMSYSDADKTAHDEPSGNIYGGGKMANVYGNTKVHIRNGNIEGDVFGAGQGDAAQPDAALVKGKTEVIIGEDPDD